MAKIHNFKLATW